MYPNTNHGAFTRLQHGAANLLALLTLVSTACACATACAASAQRDAHSRPGDFGHSVGNENYLMQVPTCPRAARLWPHVAAMSSARQRLPIAVFQRRPELQTCFSEFVDANLQKLTNLGAIRIVTESVHAAPPLQHPPPATDTSLSAAQWHHLPWKQPYSSGTLWFRPDLISSVELRYSYSQALRSAAWAIAAPMAHAAISATVATTVLLSPRGWPLLSAAFQDSKPLQELLRAYTRDLFECRCSFLAIIAPLLLPCVLCGTVVGFPGCLGNIPPAQDVGERTGHEPGWQRWLRTVCFRAAAALQLLWLLDSYLPFDTSSGGYHACRCNAAANFGFMLLMPSISVEMWYHDGNPVPAFIQSTKQRLLALAKACLLPACLSRDWLRRAAAALVGAVAPAPASQPHSRAPDGDSGEQQDRTQQQKPEQTVPLADSTPTPGSSTRKRRGGRRRQHAQRTPAEGQLPACPAASHGNVLPAAAAAVCAAAQAETGADVPFMAAGVGHQVDQSSVAAGPLEGRAMGEATVTRKLQTQLDMVKGSDQLPHPVRHQQQEKQLPSLPPPAAAAPAAQCRTGGASSDDVQQDNGDADFCAICLDAPRGMAAVHGSSAHLCVCVGCYEAQKDAPIMALCPICQLPVDVWMEYYA